MGYVAVSLLMKSEDEMMTLVVNSVRNDLVSHNNYFQARASLGCLWVSRACMLPVPPRLMRPPLSLIQHASIRSPPTQSLALASIANIGGAEFAEALTPDVQVRVCRVRVRVRVRDRQAGGRREETRVRTE